METVTVTFEFSYALFQQAQHLHRHTIRSVRQVFMFWICPVLAAICLPMGAVLFGSARSHTLREDVGAWTFIAGLAFLSWWASAALGRHWQARRLFASIFAAGAQDHTTKVRLNPDGVLIGTSRGVESRMPWGQMLGYAEDDRLLMLYLNRTRFVPVPWSALTGEAAGHVRALVAAHLKPVSP